jgi:hypothetical protein
MVNNIALFFIEMSVECEEWWTLVKTALNIRIPQKIRNFLND